MEHLTVIPADPQTVPAVQPPRGTSGRPSAAAALGHGHPPALSLYIHVPFCFHKCHYCDFYSIVDSRDRQREFTRRLVDELAFLAPHAGGRPLATIFVGGGTPTLLRVDLWRELLSALRGLFDLSAFVPPTAARAGAAAGVRGEFTVECNPETATAELMGALAEGGVNRLSIGAQSFEPRHLRTLERWHDPANVARALELAAASGIERRSIDLIFGIPGQTLAEWERDLAAALSLGLDHLSCYALTYEPNTAMTARLRAGDFARIDEDLEADMYQAAVERLRAAGLGRYEVSNFARPGHECRHNLAYWRQEQWLAAGPSASGHAWAGEDRAGGGYRWRNVPRLGDYLGSAGPSPVVDLECPDRARALRERVMTGLRTAEGVDGAEVLRAAEPLGCEQPVAAAVDALRARGWLAPHADRWRLTDAGFLMADAAAGEVMAAIA
jgi:oxygen-independent coproporphyrinogen-3 oxidase